MRGGPGNPKAHPQGVPDLRLDLGPETRRQARPLRLDPGAQRPAARHPGPVHPRLRKSQSRSFKVKVMGQKRWKLCHAQNMGALAGFSKPHRARRCNSAEHCTPDGHRFGHDTGNSAARHRRFGHGTRNPASCPVALATAPAPLPQAPVALVTAPVTLSQAPAFRANPSTRSGLVGGGITTPSSFLKPKRR
jgi:hypothetical protein